MPILAAIPSRHLAGSLVATSEVVHDHDSEGSTAAKTTMQVCTGTVREVGTIEVNKHGFEH